MRSIVTECLAVLSCGVCNTVRIFLRVIGQSQQDHCAGAAQVDSAELHIGAVAFIHSFGSSLIGHVHFHVYVVDGVFEEVELFHWTTLEQPLVADRLNPTPIGVIPGRNSNDS